MAKISTRTCTLRFFFLITRYRHPDRNWYRLGTLDEAPRSGEVPGSHPLVRVHFQAIMIAAAKDAYRRGAEISFFISLVIRSRSLSRGKVEKGNELRYPHYSHFSIRNYMKVRRFRVSIFRKHRRNNRAKRNCGN